MTQANNGQGYAGFKTPDDVFNEFTAHNFQIWQILSRVRTCIIVQVTGVTNSGGVASAGYVDLQPLVQQIDNAGNTTPHAVIYHAPYFRLQGGANAVIIDPQVGDIGYAMIADRDTSSVEANATGGVTNKQAPPGSRRVFDFADAVYIGGMLNGAPAQYLQFNAGGINVTSPHAVTINAATVAVNASTSATVTSPSIALQNAGTALKTLLNSTLLTWLNGHVHGNGNGGADTTAPTTAPASTTQTSVTMAE
jgi:hypothetical protein